MLYGLWGKLTQNNFTVWFILNLTETREKGPISFFICFELYQYGWKRKISTKNKKGNVQLKKDTVDFINAISSGVVKYSKS